MQIGFSFDAPPKTKYNPRSFVGQISNLSYTGAPIIFTIRLRALATALIAAALFVINPTVTNSTPASASTLVPSGQLIVSAESGGAWSMFTADPSNGVWQRITINATPARDPAISPDGKTIAFRSKRDGTWDIYAMPPNGTVATRLTRGMIYNGAPVWSSDGKKIAFESYAHGDLDIWVMNADGTQPIDLTDNEKSYDYAPAWSSDGKWIAFTSWRTGTQQVFIVPADCVKNCQSVNISQSKFNDQKPAWSPDGKKIAFVSDRD